MVSTGTTNPAGTGSQQTNSTSGLPKGIVDTGDPQKNLFLDPSQIAKGLAQDGTTGAGSEAGVVASATSVNNFINACLLRTDLPLTNGNQGSRPARATPSRWASSPRKPRCRPASLSTRKTWTPSPPTRTLRCRWRSTISSPATSRVNYFAAPQNVDQNGVIIGHSHVVIEPIDSLTTTTVSDPTQFAFFKGLNSPAQNGILSATVTGGLPAGTYKLSSINSAANHQPALVGVAQHGSLDDAVYFTVADNANAANASAANANGGSNGNANGNNAGQAQGQAQAQATTSVANTGNNNAGQGRVQVQQAQAATTAAANNVGQGQAQVAASSSSSSTTTTSPAANVGQGQAQVTTTSAAGQQGQGRFGGFGGRNGRNGGGRNGSNASSTSSSSATSTASLAARSALPDAHPNAFSQRRHTNRARDSKYKLERRLEALLQAQQRA
ncbi:RHTO0S16e04830g1_1 [Rhodotorula toruloides]|uniref:RHTO0S16e04830g1_1 n=1 Tax=Rhodotorula toruloides TaxID=5286 RepID=A0A061BE54_RHOTO|nr:RHTO0S16e04830g1_1 [Rhodotorula toruloides]